MARLADLIETRALASFVRGATHVSVFLLVVVVVMAAACAGGDGGGDVAARTTAEPTVTAADPTGPNDRFPAEPTATPVNPAVPVVGAWRVIGINGNRTTSEAQATLVFDDEGKVRGNASCNSFSSTYTTTGDTMAFGDITIGVDLCGPEANTQETSMLTVLNDVARHSVEDASITLTGSTGNTITAVHTAESSVREASPPEGPYVAIYSAYVGGAWWQRRPRVRLDDE